MYLDMKEKRGPRDAGQCCIIVELARAMAGSCCVFAHTDLNYPQQIFKNSRIW